MTIFSLSSRLPALPLVSVTDDASISNTKTGGRFSHEIASQIKRVTTMHLCSLMVITCAWDKYQSRYLHYGIYLVPGKWLFAYSSLPTTMSVFEEPLSGLNIISKKGATDPAAGLAKLDFTCCGVPTLYAALKRFDRRFSRIYQDVTDPVSPPVPKLPPPFAMVWLRQKLTKQLYFPDSFGSGEVS